MHNIVALSVRLIPAGLNPLILHQFQARLFKAKTINTVDYLSAFNGLGVRDGSAACEGRELYGMGNVQTGTGQHLQHSRCRHPHCFIVSSSSSSYGASSRSYSTTDRCLLSPLVERWANRSASALEPIASPFLVLSRRVIGASWLNRLLRRASVVLFTSASQITLRFNRTRRHFTFSGNRLRRVSHSAFLSHRYYLEDT